jgi:hypothetical protein
MKSLVMFLSGLSLGSAVALIGTSYMEGLSANQQIRNLQTQNADLLREVDYVKLQCQQLIQYTNQNLPACEDQE